PPIRGAPTAGLPSPPPSSSRLRTPARPYGMPTRPPQRRDDASSTSRGMHRESPPARHPDQPPRPFSDPTRMYENPYVHTNPRNTRGHRLAAEPAGAHLSRVSIPTS